MAKYTLGPLFKTSFPVTQLYGANPVYYGQFGLAGHEGVDFGTPNGTEFIAPFDGVILRDTFGDKDYGNFTVVWDPVQLCAVWFCHLQDVSTNPGDKVQKGQVLGHTNNTGNSTGPHCHVDFVETDAVGNRLNKDNGYQGYLNILDPALVQFSDSSVVDTSMTDDEKRVLAIITDGFKNLKAPDGNDFGNLEGATRAFIGGYQANLTGQKDLTNCNVDLTKIRHNLDLAYDINNQQVNQVNTLQARITELQSSLEKTQGDLKKADLGIDPTSPFVGWVLKTLRNYFPA